MPIFIFNKLIRDKLKDDYEKMSQKATYKKLSSSEYIAALKTKLIEEANEIDPSNYDEIASEIADLQQVIDDLKVAAAISDSDVQERQKKKFEKKGGFAGAHFVTTLELKEDDEWLEYYRKKPEVFIEIKPAHKEKHNLPPLERGVYEHYKGDRYEVMGVGLDTETLKPLVVYRPLYQMSEDRDIDFWVRPYELFIEQADVGGKKVARFKKL